MAEGRGNAVFLQEHEVLLLESFLHAACCSLNTREQWDLAGTALPALPRLPRPPLCREQAPSSHSLSPLIPH